MVDLRQYIPKTNCWIEEMFVRLGEEVVCKYYNRIFLRMFHMRHGESLHILDEVDPGNYELFIKCVCTCMSELASYGMIDYHLEKNATVIYRS